MNLPFHEFGGYPPFQTSKKSPVQFCVLYEEKLKKIEKSNLFIYFSLFFSMLKFFSCRSNKFFPGSFGRKELALEPFGISRGLRPLEIPKLGSLANFFFLMNLLKIFLTARKNFLIGKREK